ncbi:putative Phosphatidic acid phosphatase family protein [Heracleum sosnowskyi]|uniref:Phosphatidic acid phosphatase family protein n=1 Tax=Heracleum sosnowskyi TaxID=360622 RepID=A0AAD8MF27_9APIA|nr:putative Phosphatidic acid phosphatase family protein [Heracleum sosnowskyi]
MLRYRSLQNIAKLFRILKHCLILVFLSWISSRLPFILEISNKYFRKFILITISPLFIFLISNVIVLMLLARSGKLAASKKLDTDIFEDYAKKIDISVNLEPKNCSKESEKEVVYQDKRIIGEINTVTCDSSVEGALVPELVLKQKVLGRSKSENLKVDILKKACRKLRRSETQISRKTDRSDETLAECVEELSNEEFQRTIEAFIEKQLRFHKEEKFAIVTHI